MHVTMCNSVGLGKLLAMVLRRFDARLEYHRCPSFFIQTVNQIPRLLGPHEDPKAIKSVVLPMACPGCYLESTELLSMEHISLEGSTFQTHPRACTECGVLLRLAVDPETTSCSSKIGKMPKVPL